MIFERTDWSIKKSIGNSIDLSTNVPYDQILIRKIKTLLSDIDNFNNYPIEYPLYESISQYYNIQIKNLSIGYGAADLLERCIRLLDYETLYILEPAFELVEINARLNNINHKRISIEELPLITDLQGALYIANPNGQNGEAYEITPFLDNFKYCIIDEVYADYYKKHSVLHLDKDNLIVVKSLSKSLGLAGLRVGFCRASTEVTLLLQNYRPSYITNSTSENIIPKILSMTDGVIDRLTVSKKFLETNFECKLSHANYVLFYEPNKFTEKFGCRIIGNLYRMALADMDTLNA